MTPRSPRDSVTDAQKRRYEVRREREFYRYYEAFRELGGKAPRLCDLNNADEVRAHVPICSPDKALSAFCQLGALRTGCKRGMLFFFNVEHAHVLAEATPTLSLQDTSKHKDELWLGYSKVDRTQSVCDFTVKMDPMPGIDSEPLSTIPLNIINDLSGDTRLCGLPYVTGAPYARFYAGVPITTSKGVNIGAFCVLDDRVRPDLTADEKTFLREMSITVMEHLETIQAQAYHRRGMDMIAALETFVQDCSDLRATERESRGKSTRKTSARKRPSQNARPHSTEPSPTKRNAQVETQNEVPSTFQDDGISVATTAMASMHIEAADLPARKMQSYKLLNAPDIEPKTDCRGHALTDELHAEIVSPTVRSTFQKAAQLLRKAVGVDQIMFFDASIGSFGGLATALDEATDSSAAGTTDGEHPSDVDSQREVEHDKPCHILGEASLAEAGHTAEAMPSQTNFGEQFLKKLLRRYPRERVWSFGGYESSSSDEAAAGKSPGKDDPRAVQGDSITATSRRSRSRKHNRQEDEKLLQRMFPEARNLAMRGLWDNTRGRFYAACVFWTASPVRLFSNESEMNFISAFCDVLMEEVHRLEVEKSDRAKADFISSISHELRSPLHGILGGTEILQDSPLDEMSHSMVTQIAVCGRTLLDIIENLLDFSNINFHARHGSRGPRQLRHNGRPGSQDSSTTRADPELMSLDTDAALDIVTEEVVEAAVSAFLYKRTLNPSRSVTTILDIGEPPQGSWKCRLAVGGWKRVCINLVTNALKYTASGHILVKLRAQNVEASNNKFEAVLSVSDTGKGMSEAFVQNELFAAFTQEDSLCEGTGLGMHIVARLVKSFGGTIKVRTSQNGGGSSFTVIVPLESSGARYRADTDRGLPAHLASSTAGIWGWQSASSASLSTAKLAENLSLDSIAKCCRQIGLKVVALSEDGGPQATHVNIVAESALARIKDRKLWSLPSILKITPLVVLCDTIDSQRQMRNIFANAHDHQTVGYVVQPCGPQRLYAAIRSVLERASESAKGLRSTSKDAEGSSTTHGAEREEPAMEKTASRKPPDQLRPALPTRQSACEENANINGVSSGLHILIVEDNHINRQLLVTYARKQGHTCVTAENGEEAVKIYTEARKVADGRPSTNGIKSGGQLVPHIILMDINMPILNGFEATQRIRHFEAQNGLKPAKVFALTGLGSADAQREAYVSGCDLFLTKPVQLKELTKVIKDSVDQT